MAKMMAVGEPNARASVITPPGEGGIGIVALSGPGAAEVLQRCFRGTRRAAREIPSGAIAHGRIVRGEVTVDEVIVAHFDAAASPTGEDHYEVNCHGGVVAVQAVLGCLREAGAEVVAWRSAVSDEAADQPVLSPTAIHASAMASLQRAQTRLAAKMLLHQAGGALRRELEAVRQGLSAGRVGQPPVAARPGGQGRPGHPADILRRLLGTAPLGHALLTPPRVALAGPPNVGKSTLLNALLRRERVIVHHRPGTTRDVVRETVSIRGVPFELIDSAGIREAPGELEQEAVRRATDLLTHCDVVVLLYDVTQGPEAALGLVPRVDAETRKIIVGNKIDLLGACTGNPTASPVPPISAQEATGQGEPLPQRLPPELQDMPHLLISARDRINIEQVEAALLAPYHDQIRPCEDGGAVVFSEEIREALQRMSDQLSVASHH